MKSSFTVVKGDEIMPEKSEDCSAKRSFGQTYAAPVQNLITDNDHPIAKTYWTGTYRDYILRSIADVGKQRSRSRL